MNKKTRNVILGLGGAFYIAAVFLLAITVAAHVGFLRDDIHALAKTVESDPAPFKNVIVPEKFQRGDGAKVATRDYTVPDFVERLSQRGETTLGWMLLWMNAIGVPLVIWIIWACLKVRKLQAQQQLGQVSSDGAPSDEPSS